MLFGNTLLARAKGGILVSNDDTLALFDDRASVTPPTIIGSSEYLTGTYQQPDLGTYTGNINDLTEGQIDDLATGLDYDELGTNVIWSTLEKVWILENLEVSSGDSDLRYGFSFTYDSGISSIAVDNSGAFGATYLDVPNSGAGSATDWTDIDVPGTGDDWTIPRDTPTIPTGSGFNGNFQRVDMTGFNSTEIISDLFTIKTGVNYRLKFKYIGDVPQGLTNVQIRDSASSATTLNNIPVNTGSAIVYYSDEFSINDTQADVYIWFANSGSAQYFGIDEVKLIESATDWINPTSGLADNWNIVAGASVTPTIITGEGFVNNAQRMAWGGISAAQIESNLFDVIAGADYIISLRYKGEIDTGMLVLRVIDSADSVIESFTLPENISDGEVIQFAYSNDTDTEIRIRLVNGTTGTDYIIADEIELIEISIIPDLTPVFWVDAQKLVSADGSDRVYAWGDLSGNENHATQVTTALQPLDSIDGVYSDSSDYMNTPLIINSAASEPWTITLVVNDYTSSGFRTFLIGGTTNRNLLTKIASTNYFGYRDASLAYHAWDGDENTLSTPSSLIEDGESHILIWRCDGSNIKLYIDGVYAGYIAPSTTELIVSSIMQGYDGSNYIPTANHLEHIYFDYELTEANLVDIIDYYATKYSIPNGYEEPTTYDSVLENTDILDNDTQIFLP